MKTMAAGTFTSHVISTAGAFTSDVFAADMDNDGDIDVLAATLFGDAVAWFENLPAEGTPDLQGYWVQAELDSWTWGESVTTEPLSDRKHR